MDEFACNYDEVIAELRGLRMIALSNGRVTSANDSTVFFPLAISSSLSASASAETRRLSIHV